jgi:hypothetical protein
MDARAPREAPAGRGPFAPGDPVLTADDPPRPAGKIESVLAARGGDRLLIERAFSPGTYASVLVTQVASTEEDAAAGLRWHRLQLTWAALARTGVYRRTMGRLTPDPQPVTLPPQVDDAAALASLRQALRDDPLTADGEISALVVHGVAFLAGWVRTVGAKVVAERLARTTPGIWEAKNRLLSDEELAAAARRWVRANPLLLAATERVRVDLGRVTLHVRRDAPAAAFAAAQDLAGALPHHRGVEVRHELDPDRSGMEVRPEPDPGPFGRDR